VVQEVPFFGCELIDGNVEAQLVLRRGALEIFVAVFVARRVPRRDGQLVEPQRAIRDHLLHVDADDPAVALAVRARAERRVEREEMRRGLDELRAALVAGETRGESVADPLTCSGGRFGRRSR